MERQPENERKYLINDEYLEYVKDSYNSTIKTIQPMGGVKMTWNQTYGFKHHV